MACDLLGVSRSGFYFWQSNADKRLAEKTIAEKLLATINDEFRKSRETYGSVKITEKLRAQGVEVKAIIQWLNR